MSFRGKISIHLHSRLILIAALGFLHLVSGPRALAEQVITLDQALAIALGKNPALMAARNEQEAADARVTQTLASYYPQLNAAAGYDHTWSDTYSTSARRNISDDYDAYSAGFSVSQYLYDFGKTSAQTQQSRLSLEAAGNNFQASAITLIRDVKHSYYETLKKKQLMMVAEENVAFSKQQLAQARALYKEGMRPRIDVTRAEVQHSQAELSLLYARNSFRQSIIAMETILGGPPLQGPYSLAEEGPSLPVTHTLDSLVDQALASRPEIAGLAAQINAALAGVKSARRSSYPDLSADGSYYKSGETYPLEDERWQVGLTLNWPLFTGFRRTGLVSETEALARRLNAQSIQRKLSVIEEVSQAFLSLQASREAIDHSRIALRQAEENLAIAEGRYKTGVSDIIELSDARVLYTEARSSLVQATYEQYKAYAELEFAVGGRL